MILYGLTQKLWDRIPERIAPVLYLLLLFASSAALSFVKTDARWLWPIGITYEGFYSADYFPIFPWIFVFLLGTWLGKLVVERRLPETVYTVSPPFFPSVGRHAFLIYLLHQPVLYALTMGIRRLIGS
jgi:uncharacterized membrane protein